MPAIKYSLPNHKTKAFGSFVPQMIYTYFSIHVIYYDDVVIKIFFWWFLQENNDLFFDT